MRHEFHFLPSATLRAAAYSGLIALSMLAAPCVQAEGAFAQLYAARPPAGSSFVRVINPGATPLRVQIANGPEQTLKGDVVTSSYAIVRGQTEFVVTINGKASAPIKVAPDSFTSLMPSSPSDATQLKMLDDSAGAPQDALKAGLRFYNLSANCSEGGVSIAPAGTPLFAPVGYGASTARAINPVKATLVGRCAQVNTGPLDLPALQPGEHFSLFLMGSASKPVLRGQRSSTDGYRP
ncbi:cell division protein FtsQ [Diaphorobacter sp. HDW4A]|uniref:alginate O-acetyltransferase AlgF n=1 Tax=Diaphorobacter sp. HDW4A TaxID=2714924 RepID=UPI0014080FA5|nr:alginate O-acetyltransferase AlgF [Diaphorobacter sp. HDW4A]QIL82149.1 cell division protein FtsQ [Diaphorobacter sp. HDW4A]